MQRVNETQPLNEMQWQQVNEMQQHKENVDYDSDDSYIIPETQT